MSYIDNVIRGLVNREGGYVNDPNDPGGPTKYGITQATLSKWLGRSASIADVQNLTLEEAATIYKALFVEKPGFLKFSDDALAEQLIDAGVMHGPTQAIKLLQEAVGATQDGVVGPDTVAKVAARKPYDVYFLFMALRLELFATILTNKPKQLEDAAGWMNRCAAMLEIYSRATTIQSSYETVLWQTGTFLSGNAALIEKHESEPTAAIGWFDRAAQMLQAQVSSAGAVTPGETAH